MEGDGRPSPERLLARLHAENERVHKLGYGKLKIFLGFAAGTGKTYAMLEAAQKLKARGVDVAAGYVEPHARPETMEKLEGLEQIPARMVEYKGVQLREFDLDGALARRPGVLLVDELAHTNAPGCRHQKRYQDIQELLEHGIQVYTTVNIQHLESLNDIVGAITGIEVRERIPDAVFDQADQVKLVDIEAEELVERMKEGKIYQKAQAERALENFFTMDKLVALREIALRRMADRVNRLAEKEKLVMGTGEFSAGEHVLVCISASPASPKTIRAGARLAFAFHADFTALYVETRELQNMEESDKKRRDENLRLARTLGAKIVTVYGENISRQISEYARIGNVTKLVLGRTNHKIWFGQTKGTLVDCVSQAVPNMDIYIIPDLKNGRGTEKSYKPKHRNTSQITRISAPDFGKTAGLMALSTVLGIGLAGLGWTEPNIIMIYLLGVMATAVLTRGYLCSLAASAVSVFLFNYFFTGPRFTLTAGDSSYPVTFCMMLAVGLFGTYMVNKLQSQFEVTVKRTYRTDILLNNSRKLRRIDTREAVGNEIAAQIQKLMNFTVLVYMKEEGKIGAPRVYLRKDIPEGEQEERRLSYTSPEEKAVAGWVFGNGHRAGCTTHTLPSARAIYLPVMEGENVSAVVGMVLEERREIAPFEYGLITAMLDETALVLERIGKIEELGRKT